MATTTNTTAAAPFSTLPVEITQEILSYLPIRSLHAFGQTARWSAQVARGSMRALALGVFHTRITGLVSSMEEEEEDDDLTTTTPTITSGQRVAITLPRHDTKTRAQIVRRQNAIAADIVQRHGDSLRALELALWELEKPVADALATLPLLRHLRLCFDHPHARHPGLDRGYWDQAAAGGTVWDLLSASAPATLDAGPHLVFGRLRSLHLDRAGLADYQLQRIVLANPALRRLRLHKCRRLTHAFFAWLASPASPARVRASLALLHVTAHDEVDERVLASVAAFPALKSLSFRACYLLDNDCVQALNHTQWRIPHLTLPHSPESPRPVVIEVDPAYK